MCGVDWTTHFSMLDLHELLCSSFAEHELHADDELFRFFTSDSRHRRWGMALMVMKNCTLGGLTSVLLI